MDNSNNNELPKNCIPIADDDFMMIPLLKSYEHDVDNFRQSNIAEYVKTYHPSEYKKNNALFALQCHNKTMEPVIKMDDIVVVHPQNNAEIGDVVLFRDPFGYSIGKVIKHKGLKGIGFKNNFSECHPPLGADLGIAGKVISVMGDL